MKVKLLEIRDKMTFVPVLCVGMNPAPARGMEADADRWIAQRYLLRRVGYPCNGEPNILVTKLGADGDPAWNDPYGWGGRTMPVAHDYIINSWGALKDGDVVDVEFILGETTEPKCSERETAPL